MREIAKSVFKFFIGFLAVLILSAFLAPWLATFLPFKFGRILRRLIMIGTIGLVVGLLRSRRESLGRLGLGWQRGSLRLLGTGLLGGVFIVIAITLVQWGLGARVWQLRETDIWHWIGYFFKGLGAGLLIGTIEEFFFRGFLFITFQELWNKKASLIVTNLIYALVHFFPKGGPFVGSQPTVTDSFRILGSVIFAWSQPEILVSVLGLFLFGLVLSFVFLRTGSLYPAMGVHAGAIFGLKLNRRFLPDISGRMGILSGGKNLYDGIAGLGILILAAFFLGKGVKRRLPLALVVFLLFHPFPIQAAEERAPGEALFSFAQELQHAQAMRKGQEQSFTGEWTGNRFHFERLPGLTDIYSTENIRVGGKTLPAIWFQPWKGLDTTLVFSSVPMGRRLRLFFALGDSDFAHEGKTTPIYFEVWIGNKRLFSTQVSTKGWKDQTVDLTLPYLLEKRFRLTFKIWSSGEPPTNFVFYGYVE